MSFQDAVLPPSLTYGSKKTLYGLSLYYISLDFLIFYTDLLGIHLSRRAKSRSVSHRVHRVHRDDKRVVLA